MIAHAKIRNRSNFHHNRDEKRRASHSRGADREVNIQAIMGDDADPTERLKVAIVAQMIRDASIGRVFDRLSDARKTTVARELVNKNPKTLHDGEDYEYVAEIIDFYGINLSPACVHKLCMQDFNVTRGRITSHTPQ